MVSFDLSNFVINVVSSISNLPMSEAIIFDLGVIFIVAAIFALIARFMKQPLIPAYVLAGVVIGPLAFGFVKNAEVISALSEIGIAFLLFIAGLEISFSKIKEAGLWKIIFIGVAQVVIIFCVTLLFGGLLNLNFLQLAYIGIILAFSSTMIDAKILSDKNELVTMHGRIILGILLLQDLIAIVAIIFLSNQGLSAGAIGLAFMKLGGIIIFAFLLQVLILNRYMKFSAKSTEMLFLSSLAILFLFISLAVISGISIVIGAFIAGVILANSSFRTEVESRISPLRDFFAILFFVVLGMQVVFSGVGGQLNLLIFLILGSILLKPVFTFVLMRLSGYRPKTSFFTSISLVPLSEFSLIIGMLGVSFGVLENSILSTIILATLITMSITPYLINFKEKMHLASKPISNFLKFLPVREKLGYDMTGDKEVLIIGAHRTGSIILKEKIKDKDKILVVDFNPEIIHALIKKKVPCIYGDVSSPEILEKVCNNGLKMVVSTVPAYSENLHIVKQVKKINPNICVILTASRISEALKLYNEGADYVITPKILAGEEIKSMINRGESIKTSKNKHIEYLKEIHNILY